MKIVGAYLIFPFEILLKELKRVTVNINSEWAIILVILSLVEGAFLENSH